MSGLEGAVLLLALLLFAGSLASDPPVVAVAEPPRLEFHLCNADGRPGPVSSNLHLDTSSYGGRTLFCVRCPKGERPEPRHNTPNGVAPSSFGDARTTFVVEAGERYVYAYVGSDIDPIEGEVTIAHGDSLTVRDLRVEPIKRTQSLKIHLMRPDRTPFNQEAQVNLESLATGLTLFRSEISTNDLRFEKSYPVGRYRLRVETAEQHMFWDCGQGSPLKPPAFGDWVETIELTADEPLAIESSFWRGGRLRLALELPSDVKLPIEQWNAKYPSIWFPPEFHWLGLASHGPGALVGLRPDPGAPKQKRERGMPDFADAPLRFEFQGSAELQRPALLPGDEQRSFDWIPPGAYIAHVEARDFVPIETKLTIRADETTMLRVRLAPR